MRPFPRYDDDARSGIFVGGPHTLDQTLHRLVSQCVHGGRPIEHDPADGADPLVISRRLASPSNLGSISRRHYESALSSTGRGAPSCRSFRQGSRAAPKGTRLTWGPCVGLLSPGHRPEAPPPSLAWRAVVRPRP